MALVGEAGVGKSRLAWEITRSHRTRDWLVLEGSAASHGKTTTWLPVIDLLRAYFRIDEGDDARTVREKLIGRLLALDEALRPTLAAFEALLEIPVEDVEWGRLDAATRQRRTVEAVKSLLLRESQVQPLLLVLEDLHWIDGATQALLDSLVESLPAARVLLLVNYRPEYQHGWAGKTYYSQLRLDPLPPRRPRGCSTTLIGGDAGLAPAEAPADRPDPGEPVLPRGDRPEPGREPGPHRDARRLPPRHRPAGHPDPGNGAGRARRADRPPPGRGQARCCSWPPSSARTCPLPLLRAIADTPEQDLQRGLAHLQAGEFLYETRLFPEPEYTFRHALTLEVAYGSLLHERRRELHARIVDAIERLYPERLAEHGRAPGASRLPRRGVGEGARVSRVRR